VLRKHGYEPVLFATAEAFRNYNDFERAACIILDINQTDHIGTPPSRIFHRAAATRARLNADQGCL
jgi:FixJ family two-component response regulator